MCGFITLLAVSGQTIPGVVLRRMTARLEHRGPDDIGFACVDPLSGATRTWTRDFPSDITLSGVLFGHHRLSILDLTSAGHQPMVSDDLSCVICFNGEIYNFLELRDELCGHGVAFRGSGDTEVLLKAYERWGTDAFNRLNGMWSLVLWDGRRRALVASRDRFGVKPLYYAAVDGVWIFGSEIKGVLGYPGACRGFNQGRVLDFLRDGLTDHGEDTMFQGIRSLPPGSYMEVIDDRRVTKRFWTLSSAGGAATRVAGELIDEFEALLADSVRLRVRSDVPIGTMMSGGLDSTAITALIRGHQRVGTGASREFNGLAAFHHTFSVCWPGSESDEEAEIDLMCSELGLVSHRLYPTAETIAEVLPHVAYHLDEPFVDPIAAVQYLLMREARACDVKVVLNGHGSDEILAGYHRQFVPIFLADLLLTARPRKFLREQKAFRGSGWPWLGVFWHLLSRFMPDRAPISPLAPYRLLERLRGAGGVFADPQSASDPDRIGFNEVQPRLPPVSAALWFEFRTRNLPRWLRMEDRMSMAWSVESRLPFMDYRLVEFAFSLPDELKLRDGYNKYILREAMRGLLPGRIVENRVKRPFHAPYSEWLRGPWRSMIVDLLLGPCAVGGYLNHPRFRAKLQAFLDGNERALPPYLVWRVLNTELWLRAFSRP